MIEIKLKLKDLERNLEGDIIAAKILIDGDEDVDVIEFLQRIFLASTYTKWFDGKGWSKYDEKTDKITEVFEIWKREGARFEDMV